jgi:hypothetical protein
VSRGPDAYELEPGLRGAEAVELISAGKGTFVRFQFKRRGWPLRSRPKAPGARRVPEGEDLARAA